MSHYRQIDFRPFCPIPATFNAVQVNSDPCRTHQQLFHMEQWNVVQDSGWVVQSHRQQHAREPRAQRSSTACPMLQHRELPYLRAERAWLVQSDSMVHASWVTGSGVSLTIASGASVTSERSEQLRTVRHATRAAPVFRSPTSIYICVRRKKFDSWVTAHINRNAQREKATLLPR